MPYRNFNKNLMEKLVTNNLIIIAFYSLILSCSRTENKTESAGDIASALRTQTSNNKSSGAIQFEMDAENWELVSAKSVEQPEVKAEALADKKFILNQLHLGRHTLVIQARKQQEVAFAGIANIAVEAGTIFDLGLIALQKPAAIQGRILGIKDAKQITGALIKIPALGLKTTSDHQGLFSFNLLPEGAWKIDIHASSGAGISNSVEFFASSGTTENLGDIWIGEWPLGQQKPTLVNAPHGFLSERTLKISTPFPSAARSFKIVDENGTELLARQRVQQNIQVNLKKSGKNSLRLIVYDKERGVIGESNFSVVYDPFSDGHKAYMPRVSIDQRSVVSPQRNFTLTLIDPPPKATGVQIRFKSEPNSSKWYPVQQSYSVSLEKRNSACGRQELAVKYRTEDSLESQEFSMPVTLSCWERIPQRAQLEKLVGIENVATWTGEHAFVWSGKLTKSASAIGVRGSYTQDTIEILDNLQKEVYMDGGYVYNPTSKDMEFIVTDSAPQPRAKAGVSGRLIDPTGNRRSLVAIFGGEQHGKPIADGAVYDVSSNAWFSMQGDGAPSPRIQPSVHFVSDDEVLVWGGLGRTNLGHEVALGDGAIYNIKTHSWRRMSDTESPSPRFAHVSVWSGGQSPEFVVLGGKRPGEVYLDSGGRYSPQTDTWLATPSLSKPAQGTTPEVNGAFAEAGAVHTRLDGQLEQKGKIIVFGGKQAQEIYLRKGFVFDLDTNSVSQERFGLGDVSGVADLYINPTVFVDGDGSADQGHHFWIVAGRASAISTDIEPRINVLPYRNGQVGTTSYLSFTRSTLLPVLSRYSTGGKPLYTCCSDWLAFPSNGKTYLMNGTATHDSSVYTGVIQSKTSGGRDVSGSSQLQQTKMFHSLELSYQPSTSNFIFTPIDGVRTQTNDIRPNGPLNIFSSNSPIWDPTNRSIILYGGSSFDTFFLKNSFSGWYSDQTLETLGGWMFSLANRQWIPLPKESNTSEARLTAHNFLLGGRFYQLGGVRGGNILFDALSLDHRATLPLASPVALLQQQTDIDYDYTPLGDGGGTRAAWVSSSCVDTAQTKVLLVGGRRVANRTVSFVDSGSAITQRPTIFDATSTPPRMLYPSLYQAEIPSSDPLEARHLATVVSTPMGCFIWGGYRAPQARFGDTEEAIADVATTLNSGTMYDFESDAWSSISAVNAPNGRIGAHGLWTGEEVLIWGGLTQPRINMDSSLLAPTGVSFYNPSTQKWRSLPPADSEPKFRSLERPVWTGRNMILWRSRENENTWVFTPSENKWSRIESPAGFAHEVVSYHKIHTQWMGDRLFLLSSSESSQLALMAFFIPPDP